MKWLFWKKKGQPIVGGIREGMKVVRAKSCNECKRDGSDCVKIDIGGGEKICLV